MKNKIAIKIIMISILLYLIKNIIIINNISYQNQIIRNYDNHNKKYYGYIYIPKYNIKRLIKKGTDNKILDKYYVGKMEIHKDNLIILAGHNVNSVFHKIHYLKKGDLVYLKNEEYRVDSYKEININDYSILNKTYNKKTLILITCTKNVLKRYVVICKKM